MNIEDWVEDDSMTREQIEAKLSQLEPATVATSRSVVGTQDHESQLSGIPHLVGKVHATGFSIPSKSSTVVEALPA